MLLSRVLGSLLNTAFAEFIDDQDLSRDSLKCKKSFKPEKALVLQYGSENAEAFIRRFLGGYRSNLNPIDAALSF